MAESAYPPIVGGTGSAAPKSAAEVGGKDPSGNLQPLLVDGSGNLKVSVTGAGSGGTSSVDESAFSAGTTAGTPAMGAYQASPSALTDGQLGVVAVDANRNLKVNIVAGSSGNAAAGATGTAATINLVRAGAAFSVQLPTLLATDVQACLDPIEFAALSATALSQLNVLLAGGIVNVAAANVRTIVTGIFPNGGPTKTALIAAVKRQGSRAEVLFGIGTVVQAADVAKALRG